MPSRLTLQRIKRALDKHDREIQRAFETAIRERRDSINLRALAEAIEQRDYNRAVEIAGITGADMFPFRRAINEAYVDGGLTVTQAAPAFAARVALDGSAPRAVAWASSHVGALITGIATEQRQAVQSAIVSQLDAGQAPAKVAREIRKVIGLNSVQAGALEKARAELQLLDGRYFSRELRDRRFDGIVRRAIRDGKPLSQADIDRITGRYSERMIKHRAEVIARTESITALRAGRDEGIRQAIEQGAINPDSLVRVWSATLDARTRPDHVAMNGVEVEGVDTPFVLPDGSQMMYPGDTSLGADAAQTIMCRCFQEHRVDWLRP